MFFDFFLSKIIYISVHFKTINLYTSNLNYYLLYIQYKKSKKSENNFGIQCEFKFSDLKNIKNLKMKQQS